MYDRLSESRCVLFPVSFRVKFSGVRFPKRWSFPILFSDQVGTPDFFTGIFLFELRKSFR
ncbi:hypothetical protein CH375_12300 [Leptospira ellisii]|nr:hypothetical protein CH375_12300 [Leptospira ellisii]